MAKLFCMQVCSTRLKSPPLIFSTVGATIGYFVTHNFDPVTAGIVSSLALETIWGYAFQPNYPSFTNKDRCIVLTMRTIL